MKKLTDVKMCVNFVASLNVYLRLSNWQHQFEVADAKIMHFHV